MVDKVGRYLDNLWIQYPSVAYRREVEHYLKLIRSTKMGEVLVKYVSKHAKFMVILPYVPTKEDPVNATAGVHGDEKYDDSLDAGYVEWMEITIQGIELKFPKRIGTGLGTGVVIRYSPATWRELAKRKGGYIAPGDGPGEVLFHEMTHGHRKQAGLTRRDPVAGWEDMTNTEEFYAILAANIYRSERGFQKLRKDHGANSGELQASLATSDAYYKEFKSLIDSWFGRQPAFCLDMAQVPAKFNPLRAGALALGKMSAAAVPVTLRGP